MQYSLQAPGVKSTEQSKFTQFRNLFLMHRSAKKGSGGIIKNIDSVKETIHIVKTPFGPFIICKILSKSFSIFISNSSNS